MGKNVAAYLLAILGGNKEPTEADIKKILEAASANVDAEAIKKVVSELKGKSVYEVMDQVPKNLPLFLLVQLVVELVVVLLLQLAEMLLLLLPLLLKKRKKNLTKTWVSVCLIKHST